MDARAVSGPGDRPIYRGPWEGVAVRAETSRPRGGPPPVHTPAPRAGQGKQGPEGGHRAGLGGITA